MHELKHFRFDPVLWFVLFGLWVVGVFTGLWIPTLAPYEGWGIVGAGVLTPLIMLVWLVFRYTKIDYQKHWWQLQFWPVLVTNFHVRKRTWLWLSYALILTLSTCWVAYNAVHWSWLVVIVAVQLVGLAFLLLEAETFLTRNYYMLEYAAAIAVMLNLTVVLAAIAALFFLNQWQLPWWVVWGTATVVITMLGSAYALVYVEEHNYWVPVVLALLYGVLWYFGLDRWFAQFPWLWLAPVVLYGYLLNVLDIWLYREHKGRQLFWITMIFLLTGIVLLR